MKLTTTCLGAYPKPPYVRLPDWFNLPAGPDTANPTVNYLAAYRALGDDAERIIERGIREVIADQVACGIDIPTDGEVRRENYIHYHCRHLEGIDFNHLTPVTLRNGAYTAWLPTIVGPLRPRELFLAREWRIAQEFTERPLKVTMPGPMTIADTTANDYYDDPARLGAALAAALNREVLDLCEAGCRYIQIDEPLFARKPGEALAYGMDNLAALLHKRSPGVHVTVHVCCGYPDALDNPDYPKADNSAYPRIAAALDACPVDAVSLEDKHCGNDLRLLEQFKRATVVLGAVAIASSRIEEVEEIRARLREALTHIEAERLMVAPDCGLGLLGRELALSKLRNMCQASRLDGA